MPTEAVAVALRTRVAELSSERLVLVGRLKAIDADIQTLRDAECILGVPGCKKQRDGQRTVERQAKQAAADGSYGMALAHGAFTRAVLEALREAELPLTAMETGEAALARLGLPPDAFPKHVLSTRVTAMSKTYVRKGTLRRIDVDGQPLRLEVAR